MVCRMSIERFFKRSRTFERCAISQHSCWVKTAAGTAVERAWRYMDWLMQDGVKRPERQQVRAGQTREPALVRRLQQEGMQPIRRGQPQPETALQRGLDRLAGFRPVTRVA